eukprot:SAG31_NODE_5923_length_2255_cov_10.354824_2_plen_179_part_00
MHIATARQWRDQRQNSSKQLDNERAYQWTAKVLRMIAADVQKPPKNPVTHAHEIDAANDEIAAECAPDSVLGDPIESYVFFLTCAKSGAQWPHVPGDQAAAREAAVDAAIEETIDEARSMSQAEAMLALQNGEQYTAPDTGPMRQEIIGQRPDEAQLSRKEMQQIALHTDKAIVNQKT